MITTAELEDARKRAVEMIRKTGVSVTPTELAGIEVADFGLNELEVSGAQILTLVDNEAMAAKLLVMFPTQTEPEHTHPAVGTYLGKYETIRCEWGELFVYGPGEATENPKAHPPSHRRNTYTVYHEHVLRAGDQVTFPPGTPHWFQGGAEGSVIWSFSTRATDTKDVFTDPNIRRQTIVMD